MLFSSEISPTRYYNCVFILRNVFTLHVSGNNFTHHQEYSKKLRGLSPGANYTDRAAAAGRRS